MREFQFAILFLMVVFNSHGQTAGNGYCRIDVAFTKEKHPTRVYAKVEIKSPFRGDSAWLKSFEKNLNQSLQIHKRAKKGKYIVSAQFVITKDGSLSDIRCLNDPGYGTAQAVIRALKKGMAIWKPIDANGREVYPYRKSGVTVTDSTNINRCFNGHGQTTTKSIGRVDVEITRGESPAKIYVKAEIRTAFIGGDSSWLRSFEEKLTQSLLIDNRIPKGVYVVSAQFFVAEDGGISDIRCLNDCGYGMGQQVMIALRNRKASWEPDSTGRPVRPYSRSAVADTNYKR